MAKTDKICIVCGEKFQGTAKAEVCGPKCRKKLQRLKEAGKKPEYALIGGKNTKPLTFQPPIAKTTKIEIPLTSKVKYKKATKKSYNGEKMSGATTDETGQFSKEQPKPKGESKVDRLRWFRENNQ